MQNIVIDKPYVPVPPHEGRIWPAVLSWYLPRLLAKKYGVKSVQCEGEGKLADSIRAGHGILLAPNHCRDEDPMVLGLLSRKVGQPFFIMASWHVFMQGGAQGFLLRRAGAFSVYREGIDRAAVNTAVGILENARRPLVIFAEGHISRANDLLNDLLDGTALIARSAAKRRAKMEPPKKVVVHPVALRYKFRGNIEAAANAVLDEIETRLTWRKQNNPPLVERIYKVGTALLTLKELEYLGHPQTGDIAQRLRQLIDAILDPLEIQWLTEKQTDSTPSRVKRLRSAILPDLAKGDLDEPERQRRWLQLADVYLAQQLFHYPPHYVKSNPTSERILETLQRFEEDLTDRIRVHGDISATITVGDAIEVAPAREARGQADPLMEQIEAQLRSMLGIGEAGR
jgi:1-acyl-sn-glycerol-3-phosphate acyltransferase